MYYSFSIDLAVKHGVDEAIMLYNLIFWLRKNKTNGKNIHDGRAWTYNSASSMEALFPFWNARKIARLLVTLENRGIIMSGNYNKAPYDRTKWYAFVDETLLEVPLDNMSNGQDKPANGITGTVQPIPDHKPDRKTDHNQNQRDEGFDEFWIPYNKKQGKPQAQRFWGKLSKSERREVMGAAPDYIASTPDRQYRMAPATYINKTNKRWQDEILIHDATSNLPNNPASL